MPIYEYTCQQCGHDFEYLLRGDEKPACPACGKRRLAKRFSVPAAHTEGSALPQCPAREAGACGHSPGGQSPCGQSPCGPGGCGMF